METREEKMASWARSSNERLKTVRILEGWLDTNGNDVDKRLRTSSYRLEPEQLNESLLDISVENRSDVAPPGSWHSKVASFPRLRDGRLTLSFSKEIFKKIQNAWHLHPRTIEVFLSNNGILSSFASFDRKQISRILKVSNSRSTGFDCVSVTCDASRSTTYVLYHHLQDEDSVFETLLATPEHCYDPHFFLAAVYRSHHQNIEAHRNTIDDAVRNIERQTGFGTPGRLTWCRGSSVDAFINPRSVIRQLGYCQTDLAIIANVARCCFTCGGWLMQAIDEVDRSETTISPELKPVLMLVRQEVEYSRRRTEMLLSQIQSVRDRAQSQTDFILHSIAQSDAEYTAAIAMDAKRDSIAMKTVAILGIVFLPGTFTATFFSVGMFDWGSADGAGPSSLRISSSMWIYWAVTLPLTAVTISIWTLWSWKEMSQSNKRLLIKRDLASEAAGSAAATTNSGFHLIDVLIRR